MPELSLFQPTVLLGLVEKFTAPESLTMLNRISRTPSPVPTAMWEVIRGSRAIARPNVPNSEAHIVPRLGRENLSASFAYLREKKVFEPTTLRWLKEPGTIARINAEKAVTREINDLNVRFDNFAEYAIWQMFTGRLQIEENGDAPAIDVDYKMLDSHKPTASTPWADATPDQLIADIRSWKNLVSRNGRVNATEAYASEKTINYIFDSFATAGSANMPAATLLSDRMKDQYYTQGTLPNFMGIDWKIQEAVFDANGKAYTDNPSVPAEEQRFLADDHIVFGNFTDNRPFELIEGPTADLDAPQGYTGKFAKTFFEPDPSQRQFLLEWHLLPVLTLPEQIVYANVGE